MSFLRPTGAPEADIDAVAAWLDARDPAPVVIATSGSTGAPKQVLLPRSAVLASAAASAARVGSGRWVLALPSAYVAGLNVVVRSLVAGHRPLVLEQPHPAAVDGGLPDGGLMSVVPTQLHRWLDSPDDVAQLRRLRTILVGGGPVPSALRARAAELDLPVVATYGMAETCGGCVYDGLPLDGVTLEVAEDGRIRIGGPTLFAGYLDDPAATAESLADGRFRTADAGRLDDDGRLHVLGRVDDIVVSGGVNVPTPAVAARLGEHPDVSAAGVVGVPDEEWGQRVVAVVTPGDSRLTLAAAREWVFEVHPRTWAPRELVVVDRLPMLANGKVDRLRLAELAKGAAT